MSTAKKPSRIKVQEALERRILKGLSCEWDHFSWQLPSRLMKTFHKPIFSLGDMTDKWGYWSSEKSEICMSRHLVLNYSWDSVREVLLHEMAHQLAQDVLDVKSEPPHGPGFRDACKYLRADPKSVTSFAPLNERVTLCSKKYEDTIVRRVKKLMTLAQSKNKHEAESAISKAHSLIEKHNIDLIKKDAHRDFITMFINKPALRHTRDAYHLSNLLRDFYFVYVIWVPAYVLEKEKMGRVLEITGTPQNTKIAAYVHDYINQFIQSQWSNYNKERGLNHPRRIDFAVGIIEGFRSKLKSNLRTTSKNRRALIKTEDPLLKRYAAYKYPRTVNVRSKPMKRNLNVLSDGIYIGKRLSISKGIEIRSEQPRLQAGASLKE